MHKTNVDTVRSFNFERTEQLPYAILALVIRPQTVDMLIYRKFAMDFGAIDVHLECNVIRWFVKIMVKPNCGCGAISKFPNYVVAVLEYLSELDRVVVFCFVAWQCPFLD